MTVRSIITCQQANRTIKLTTADTAQVWKDDPSEINNENEARTLTGEIKLTITNSTNPDFFSPGKHYYIYIAPVHSAEPTEELERQILDTHLHYFAQEHVMNRQFSIGTNFARPEFQYSAKYEEHVAVRIKGSTIARRNDETKDYRVDVDVEVVRYREEKDETEGTFLDSFTVECFIEEFNGEWDVVDTNLRW